VEYGTTAAYGSITSLSSTLVTNHGKTVSGLQASTTYHYRISSADAAGNLALSGDNTFTTSEPPGSPPSIIFGISASEITSSDAVISWSTDVVATSQLKYGTTTLYGSSSALDPTLLSSHGQTIAGLLPGTLYHYQVRSTDAAGNLSVSSNHVFTSAGPANTTPPGNVQNFAAVAGNQKITLSWTNPTDNNFVGVRILYRTDRFPTNINDGTLLGDFTGLQNTNRHTTQAGLQNGVTYYYSASSYDGSGNFQSTAHASATPSSDNGNFQQTIGGGCGMIFPKDGKPPGPAQAADMLALLMIMLILLMRRRIQSLKSQVFYLLSPAGISLLSPLGQKQSFDRCRGVSAILKSHFRSLPMGYDRIIRGFRCPLAPQWLSQKKVVRTVQAYCKKF
jgi:hypothetical protein